MPFNLFITTHAFEGSYNAATRPLKHINPPCTSMNSNINQQLQDGDATHPNEHESISVEEKLEEMQQEMQKMNRTLLALVEIGRGVRPSHY